MQTVIIDYSIQPLSTTHCGRRRQATHSHWCCCCATSKTISCKWQNYGSSLQICSVSCLDLTGIGRKLRTCYGKVLLQCRVQVNGKISRCGWHALSRLSSSPSEPVRPAVDILFRFCQYDLVLAVSAEMRRRAQHSIAPVPQSLHAVCFGMSR